MSKTTNGVWENHLLGSVSELRRGITYNSEMLDDQNNGLFYINMKSFLKGGGFNADGLKRFSGFYKPNDLVDENDLLIANTDVTSGDIVGVPALLPEELKNEKLLYSHHVTLLRLNGSVLVSFLYYLLCLPEYRSWMIKFARGTTVLMLDSNAIKKIPIRVPKDVKHQNHIIEILSTVDEEIEQTEVLIAKCQKIKAGLMNDLFTRGVTPDGCLRPTRARAPELYKQSPLGWIPQEWTADLLDRMALRGSGHTPNKNHPEFWNGGVKWISLSDSWRLDKVYISETDKEISRLGIANSSAVIHPAGIVVLSRDAGIGKSAITTSAMAVSQHFMCWRCDSKLNKYYLYYWLQDKKREFENIATGSTIPTIGLRFFKNYKISIPVDVKEQERIVSILLESDKNIFKLESELEKLKSIKRGLMQDLLTGRVRVKVPELVNA